MPKGPQGQKRPAETVACAIVVAKIATGEVEETYEEPAERKQYTQVRNNVIDAKRRLQQQQSSAKKTPEQC